jgi:bacterial/archaeal transporter family-2 protein
MRDQLRTVGILAAIVGGAAVAIQSKVNGALGDRLSDGFAAALISFGSGLLLIAVITAVWSAARHGVSTLVASLRDGSLHWWQCLGGVCGAALVASQGLTVTALGVAIFTVAAVAGQTLASLAVDRAGAGPNGPQPLTVARVIAAALTIVAVVVAVANRFGAPRTLEYALLPLVAGAATAWQQAVNGRVRGASRSVTAATLVNFMAGTSALAIAYGIDVGLRGTPAGHLPTEPWYYLGGAIGAVFIALSAAVVRHTGVLLLGLGMVAGQLIGALVIDTVAPTSLGRPTWETFVGVALTLVAVMVAAGSGDRRRRTPIPQATRAEIPIEVRR